mgnify:CR=1 FL=1
MTEDKILDKEFEVLVNFKLNDNYCVLVSVYYDNSSLSPNQIPNEENIKSRFKDNKDKLEKFVEENGIHVYDKLDYMPRMSLKVTGKQILDLLKKDYVEYISKDDEIVVIGV